MVGRVVGLAPTLVVERVAERGEAKVGWKAAGKVGVRAAERGEHTAVCWGGGCTQPVVGNSVVVGLAVWEEVPTALVVVLGWAVGPTTPLLEACRMLSVPLGPGRFQSFRSHR